MEKQNLLHKLIVNTFITTTLIMKNIRSIKRVIYAQKVNMGGHMLDQALPMHGIDQIDPFLLLHHWASEMPGGDDPSQVGVGPHPHRGFAPVTYIFDGNIHHRDSIGNSSIVHEGGTQWMHAGTGIVHSERPSKALAEKGGKFEFLQIWINTPAANKMTEPFYLPLNRKDVPEIVEEGKRIGVFSGTLSGLTGKVEYGSPLTTARFELESGKEYTFDLTKNQNLFIYQLNGKLLVNGEQEVDAKGLTWFENNGETVTIKALESTRGIILGGEPINEEISTYGPFVMNNQREIRQAINDYNSGLMGTLVEDFE